MTETWLEEETWKKIKNKLFEEFEWRSIWAESKNRKGRAKDNIVLTIRKEIEIRQLKDQKNEQRYI